MLLDFLNNLQFLCEAKLSDVKLLLLILWEIHEIKTAKIRINNICNYDTLQERRILDFEHSPHSDFCMLSSG